MLKERAEKVGKMADNEMEAYVSGDMKRLRFEVEKMKNTDFLGDGSEALFPSEILDEAKKRAKKFRFAPTEKIKKIWEFSASD